MKEVGPRRHNDKSLVESATLYYIGSFLDNAEKAKQKLQDIQDILRAQ